MAENIQTTSPITSLFYKDVPDITGDETINLPLFLLEDFASISIEAVYVLDFLKRGFHYVANRDFFLCGHSVEEALSLGYDFFPSIIHGKDLSLLENMHSVILQRLFNLDKPDEVNYFSFTVRIKSIAGYIIVYHKLKPIFIDGQPRFGLCLLASSVLNKSGHLRAFYNNNPNFEEYSSKNGDWQKKTLTPLTVREKKVLILAKQGKTNEQIADIICIEHQTVRNIENTIYRKWQVNSIVQAISFGTNHHLIYVPEQCSYRKKLEKTPIQKLRRPMTSEKLRNIQDELNRGKSINSIAKQANISEFTLR